MRGFFVKVNISHILLFYTRAYEVMESLQTADNPSTRVYKYKLYIPEKYLTSLSIDIPESPTKVSEEFFNEVYTRYINFQKMAQLDISCNKLFESERCLEVSDCDEGRSSHYYMERLGEVSFPEC